MAWKTKNDTPMGRMTLTRGSVPARASLTVPKIHSAYLNQIRTARSAPTARTTSSRRPLPLARQMAWAKTWLPTVRTMRSRQYLPWKVSKRHQP